MATFIKDTVRIPAILKTGINTDPIFQAEIVSYGYSVGIEMR